MGLDLKQICKLWGRKNYITASRFQFSSLSLSLFYFLFFTIPVQTFSLSIKFRSRFLQFQFRLLVYQFQFSTTYSYFERQFHVICLHFEKHSRAILKIYAYFMKHLGTYSTYMHFSKGICLLLPIPYVHVHGEKHFHTI